MFGIVNLRKNSLFPYMSRGKTFSYYLFGLPQEEMADVMVGDGSLKPQCVPFQGQSIEPESVVDDLEESQLNDWSLIKRKELGDGDGSSAVVSYFEMSNPLLSLPIVYLSRSQYHLRHGSLNYLNGTKPDMSVSIHNLLFSADDKNKDSKTDTTTTITESKEENIGDQLTKTVKWRKANVTNPNTESDMKSKLTTVLEEKALLYSPPEKPPLSAAGGAKGFLKKGKSKPQKEKGPKGPGGWAGIEKQLPVWQNLIADILQKCQDLVFKKK